MKTARLLTIPIFLSAALTLSAMAAPSAPAAKKPAPAPDQSVVPQSTFVIPTKAGEARDPFYPNRTIQQQEAVKVAVVTNAAPTGLSCLTLKGLSGTPANPLAMINGRTMARGEDAEINTPCGRLLVHCVDISTNSATVEVSGERRQLFLPTDL